MSALTLGELVDITMSLKQTKMLMSLFNINATNIVKYLRYPEFMDIEIDSYEDYCLKIENILEILKTTISETEHETILKYKGYFDSLVLDAFNLLV